MVDQGQKGAGEGEITGRRRGENGVRKRGKTDFKSQIHIKEDKNDNRRMINRIQRIGL